MKNKTSFKLIAFAFTLLFSIATVTTFFSNKTFSFFNNEDNFKARVKVYNFLLADKAHDKRSVARWGEQRLKLEKMTAEYTSALSPEEREQYLNEIKAIAKAQINERLNADTSELPEDVRGAWSKMMTDRKAYFEWHWSEANSEVKRELQEKLNKEAEANEEKFRKIVKKYGFELDVFLRIIEKEG
jgi:hypothetical protein